MNHRKLALEGFQKSCSAVLACCSVFLPLIFVLSGCATPKLEPSARTFAFHKDTLAYTNELIWEYHYDTNGNWVKEKREPKPTYFLHCFVMARSVRQFFLFARFAPELPVADEETYRQLIRAVISTSPRKRLAEGTKIVIPGYANLREFSEAQEESLKAECGGAWQSYVQRGHWRMIFPFSRRHQERMAAQLLRDLNHNEPLVVHLVRFPNISINHAVAIFDARETDRQVEFYIYDPNAPFQPRVITYDRAAREFTFPTNKYFPGGRVDVYQLYWKWNY